MRSWTEGARRALLAGMAAMLGVAGVPGFAGFAGFAVAGGSAGPSGPGQEVRLPIAEMVARARADHGLEEAQPEEVALEDFLAEHFVRVPLGLYDLRMPARHAQDAREAERLIHLARELLDAQMRWLAWLDPGGRAHSEREADVARLSYWLGKLRARDVAAAIAAGGRDLLELGAAGEREREAAARFADFMRRDGGLGLERAEAPPPPPELAEGAAPPEPGLVPRVTWAEPLLLVPQRAAFVELAALGGWMQPDAAPLFHHDGIASWSEFYLRHVKVVALELAVAGAPPGGYATGDPVGADSETGLEQQVVQLALNSLLDGYYGGRMPSSLASAIAVDLVIDLYGECDTRVDGDLRSRKTEAREVFVPGGQSEGGILAKDEAGSRWREDEGADRFVRVLRVAQQEGFALESNATSRIAYFALHDDTGKQRAVVAGPFLGSAARQAEVDARFAGDHLEFLRAYRTAFVWWLREVSQRGAKSKQAFAGLLRALAESEPAELEATFEEAFGKPLSDAEASRGSLEGEFLYWLSRQRA